MEIYPSAKKRLEAYLDWTEMLAKTDNSESEGEEELQAQHLDSLLAGMKRLSEELRTEELRRKAAASEEKK